MLLSVRLAMKSSQLQLHRPRSNEKSTTRHLRVAVVGASGGIGQTLSLLLKQNSLIETLALHDVVNTKGVAADLSHVCTATTVLPFDGPNELNNALKNADLVVVPAGMPRKPGMTRDDLVDANASIAIKVATAVSESCPGAIVAFITNPVNVIVPIAAEILKAKEVYDPKRLFGVTTLDVVRAKTFLGEYIGVEPEEINIPVIGGHAGSTILPILSQCEPCFDGNDETKMNLVHRIQEGGTEVVKAKAGKGSATLSMAYAGAQFVNSLLCAFKGVDSVIECAYVESDVTAAEFFSTPLLLGPQGIKENLGLPEMDEEEQERLQCMLPELQKSIKKGQKLAEFALECLKSC